MNDFDYLETGAVYLDAACQSLRPRPVIDALSWTKKEKEDISTHLTINQTLASTIFAALLRGNTVEKALKIGVANLELSTLNSTASLEMIQQYIEENR